MRSRYIALVALSALFLLFLSEGLTLLSGESDLSVYDESDRGLSRAFGSVPDDLEVSTLLTSPSLLIEEDEPERTLLVNIGPQRAYSLTEVHIIRKFMDRGGRVLMADDHGFLNTLAGEMGITFVEGQLYDENFKDTPDLVRVDDVKIGDLSGIVLLNKPSSLRSRAGKRVY
ncbi:MAG: DUF4350 domain-containing protein [Candidatus Thermoplasmatota archaeon]|nr:DUF4350 domain-containing protein [Candidatus Thermoplasmatota archaeon]